MVGQHYCADHLICCAANLAVQGVVKCTDGNAVFAFDLVRSLLLFDVLSDNSEMWAADTTGKVRWRPKRTTS